MPDARIVVTGADGFIGRHLVPRLRGRGHEVVRVVRRPGERTDIVVDLIDGLPDDAVRPGDCVVHLAGVAERGAAAETHRAVNCDVALAVGATAARRSAARLVFMSSARVYGVEGRFSTDSPRRPTDDYGRAKAEAEEGLHRLGDDLPVSILRPPPVYGSEAHGNLGLLTAAIRRRVPVPVAAPPPRQSLVAVDSLCSAVEAVAGSGAAGVSVHQVSDRNPVPLDELVRAIGVGLGRRGRPVPVPPRLMALGDRVTSRLLGRSLAALSREFVLDPDPTLEALGWVPVEDTLDGVSRAVARPAGAAQ